MLPVYAASSGLPSADSRYWLPYPAGNAPTTPVPLAATPSVATTATAALTAGSGSAFVPNSGFSITATSLADGESITITGPSGSFGTKPNGALVNYLARYGAGYNPQAGIQDPLSRNTWTDAFWPATGATGPVSGLPGLQSSVTAPGSAKAFKTVFPGAAVITGTLTNGSANITDCTDQGVTGATPFADVDYAYSGLPVADLSTGWSAITSATQSNLGSGIILMTSAYTGTSGTYTLNVAYGPDQWSNPKPLIATPTQDQIFAFRGMNNFPWRSTDFNLQNNKFVRVFCRTPGLGIDVDFASDGNGSDTLIGGYSEGTTLPTGGSGWTYFNGGAQYSWTANQWFQHQVFYHGNSTQTSFDGGFLYLADGRLLLGALGSVPNLGKQYYGTANGGGGHPTQFDFNDIACRPASPQALDAVYVDYTMFDDSPCCIQIGSGNAFEMQWPTAWSDTSVTFVMHRSYLDATIGTGSLAGLSLVIQKSDYTRTTCGVFTSAA